MAEACFIYGSLAFLVGVEGFGHLNPLKDPFNPKHSHSESEAPQRLLGLGEPVTQSSPVLVTGAMKWLIQTEDFHEII